MTMIATISHRISSPIRTPDIRFPPSVLRPTRGTRGAAAVGSRGVASDAARPRADRLEMSYLLRQRPLHRQPFHRGRAVEAVAVLRMFHDEVGIGGLGDRAAMRQDQDFGIDAERRSEEHTSELQSPDHLV